MFKIHSMKLISSNLTALFAQRQILSSHSFTCTALHWLFRNITLLSSNFTDVIRVSHYCLWYVRPEESAGAPTRKVWQETQYVRAHGRILK
jgi:hypothetical protein